MKVKKAVKQMAALGTGAVMVGASLLGASAADHVDLAAYPSQYIQDGKFNGVMVVGDKAAADDVIGVTDIAISLQSAAVKKVAGSSSTTVTVDGEAWKAGTSTRILEMAENLNSGNNRESIATITSSSYIDDEELPNLLSDGALTNSKGTADYEQRLYFEDTATGYVLFTEDDQDETSDFLFFASGKQIARYEMEFTTALESDVDDSTGSADTTGLFLTDMEDIEMVMLGKPFTIVTAKRVTSAGSSIVITMMGGAVRDTLLEGDTKTYTVDGKDYEVTLNFVDADEAQFVVNGETTQKINDGDTDILSDGTTIGVSDILYQDYAGGVHSSTFFIGADKIELKDTLITDTASSTALKVNEETIDDADVTIEGTDDNTTFKIDRISVNMSADDDFYVPPGGKLSENPDIDEPEVMFGQNWDITYKGLSVSEDNQHKIEIDAAGSDDYNLHFYDGSGNKAKLPIAHAPSSGTFVKFGDDDDDLIVSHNRTINKDDYFIISDTSDDNGERPSYAIRYRGADKSTADSPVLKFDVLGQSGTEERPLSVGAVTTGCFISGNCTAGSPDFTGYTAIARMGDIRLGGATFAVFNASTHTADDFDILVDIDADGTIDEPQSSTVTLNTKHGAQITITNDTAASVTVVVDTPNTDHFDDLTPTAFRYNITADGSGEVRLGNEAGNNHNYRQPEGEDDNQYAYSAYGAKALLYSPSSDPQEVTIWYPSEQNVPLVYVTGEGTTLAKADVAGEGDTVVIQKIDVGATKLASEVSDITSVNSILVGGPCANNAAATVMGNPADCTEGFKPGTGRIVIWGVGDGDNVAMLVAGFSALDTRNAAQVVAQYREHAGKLTGTEVEVTKTNNQITVAKPVAVEEKPMDDMADDAEADADAEEGSDEETA